MKQMEGVIASTCLDSHGERLTREALADLADSIGRKFIPIGIEHDPRKAPIGRLASAFVRERDDGESEVVAVLEIFEADDQSQDGADGREMAIQSREQELAITCDWTHRDPVDQEDVLAIANLLGSEPVYEGKKAAEPISVITFIAGTIVGGIAAGFLNQVGADAWALIKVRLNRIFSRQDKRKGEQLLKFSCLREIDGTQVEVVLVATNPNPQDIDDLLDHGLSAVDRLLPLYARNLADLRRLTFEYKDGDSVLLFGVSKDCKSWRPTVVESTQIIGEPLRLTLFKDSESSFTQALEEARIEYRKITPMPGAVMASGVAVEIAQTVATSSAIAAVLVAWIRARASRKVILTTATNEVIHIEGCSVKEVKGLLPLIRNGAVIDTARPSEPNEAT